MLNDRLDAARSIRRHLKPAELDLCSSLTSWAQFLAHLPEARAAAGVSPTAGHEVIEAVLDTCSTIVAAMGKANTAHALLADVAGDLGVSTRMVGGSEWKGPAAKERFADTAAPLHVVA